MDRQADPQTAVAAAKQRLRASSGRIDYLAPVKRYPLETTGAAFLAGFMLKRLGSNHLPPGLLSLAVQLLKRL